MTEAKRPRSAEQTARLLLSNAFRYDTWECNAAKREVQRLGGEPTTVQLTFSAVEKQELPSTALDSAAGAAPAGRVEEFNLSLFDPENKVFVGAAYRCERRHLHEPLVFQATPKQVVVVELLVRDTRPTAPLEEMRVTHWAHCPVEALGDVGLFALRPGNAHLLLLDEALWPAATAPAAAAVGSLSYKCKRNKDPALSQLMGELVPPGVFVTEAFTKATPKQGGKSFRLVISSIELTGTSQEATSGLLDGNTDWAVAAVAHNGYQQLGQGAEVPLAIEGDVESSSSYYDYSKSSTTASTSTSSNSYSDSSYGYSYDSKSSGQSDSSSSSTGHRHSSGDTASTPDKEKAATTSSGNKKDKRERKARKAPVLRSELPLEMGGLPVHSATSLVLAIRRRTPDSNGFKVLGFCVFPLCVMPMQNRDVRVENLPALRGPFSCEDARMLMVDAASPYGRVPIAMTVTMEYHDVQVPAEITSPPEADAVTARPTSPLGAEKHPGGEVVGSLAGSSPLSSGYVGSSGGTGKGSRPPSVTVPPPLPEEGGAAGEVAAREQAPVAAAVLSTGDTSTPQVATQVLPPSPQPSGEVPTSAAGSDGIFRLLCTIMEEIQKVRETQDVILRQTAAPSGRQQLSPEMQERLNNMLADGPFDLIDLSPRPLAVSWLARRAITENVQPIYHPTRGTILDDNAPAPPGSLPCSLFGIRFEGATLDCAIAMPDDVCVMFSFGPLPYQQVGPMHATSVEKPADNVSESFKFFDADGRGAFVWCEPTEALASVAMAKYKECGGNSTVYLHLYDALTMFYLATATVPLSLFHRPYNAEAAVVPMDLALQRDFSMTEQLVPPKIFPMMRHAGQLHVSLFCVGVMGAGEGGAAVKSSRVREPHQLTVGAGSWNGCYGNVIVARKLAHVDQLQLAGSGRMDGESAQAPPAATPGGAPDGSVDTPRGSNRGSPAASPPLAKVDVVSPLHWQRADYVKRQLASHSVGSALMPGVPEAHVHAAQVQADMEFKLRYAEKQRSEAKARAIAAALSNRMTVRHELQIVAWRPETTQTPFQNPHSVPMQFFVDVPDAADKELCSVLGGAASFHLGPRERTEVTLVVRLFPGKNGPKVGDTRVVRARICSERREVMRLVEIQVTLAPPLVDRRYEIFGPVGSVVSKRLFSRLYSASSFPIASSQNELLKRMRDLCSYAATSSQSGRTTVETNAVLDPITQCYVTAWEEATVTTTIPAEMGRQRTEYVTLFYDAEKTRVYETWELAIFPCECLTTREIAWGQTTALGLPAAGTEELYCDQPSVQVESTGASYVLRLRPKEATPQRMLLHSLMADGNLRKTVMTIPVVYPTPNFTQVIELSMADVAAGPIFRRLTFKHRGDTEEVFQVHHNYRYQLKISPQRFALAPNDIQFISLQFDSLVLPPGQLEGRWPMWIFINNADDKTVESYYLQVVLRAHPVVAPPNC